MVTGQRWLLVGDGIVVMAGILLLAPAPTLWPAAGGLVLIGLEAANFVPALVGMADRNLVMPANLAIAAVTTTVYAGVLLGPVLLDIVAHHSDLPTAFELLAAVMVIVPLVALAATRKRQ